MPISLRRGNWIKFSSVDYVSVGSKHKTNNYQKFIFALVAVSTLAESTPKKVCEARKTKSRMTGARRKFFALESS